MTPERLIELARNAGMFVTTEMKWQYERWEGLAKLIAEENQKVGGSETATHNAELMGAKTIGEASRSNDVLDGKG